MSELEHTAGRALMSTGLSASSIPGEGGFIVDGRNQGNPLHDRPYYRRQPGPFEEGGEDVRRELVRQGLLPDLWNLTPKALQPESNPPEPERRDKEVPESHEEGTAQESSPVPEDPDGEGQSSSFIIANE